MYLDYNEINLHCLRASEFNGYAIPADSKCNSRTVYDYEIEYYTKSDGGIEIDGVYVPFEDGSINFRKPGQRVRGVMPYRCYILCIDMTGDKNRRSQYDDFGCAQTAQPNYENELLLHIPDHISGEQSKKAGDLIRQIYQHYVVSDLFMVKALLYQLFTELFSIAQKKDEFSSPYPFFIKKAVLHIQNHYTQPIKMEELAGISGLSVNYFHHVFKQYTGKSPNSFITDLRMEHAKHLLMMTDMPVAQIGESCGIDDAVYFSYLFKKWVGVPAGSYRKSRTKEPV